jgi:hypothetical protein
MRRRKGCAGFTAEKIGAAGEEFLKAGEGYADIVGKENRHSSLYIILDNRQECLFPVYVAKGEVARERGAEKTAVQKAFGRRDANGTGELGRVEG